MLKRKKAPKYILFRDCHELTMDRFIAAICDGALDQIVKTGIAPIEVLQAHFQAIYNEFIDLRGDKNSAEVLAILKEITYANNKKFIVQECVDILRLKYVREVAIELHQMGFSARLDPSNQEAYQRELNRILVSLKRTDADIKTKEKELAKFKEKQEKEGGLKRSDFDHMNSSLSKYMGFHIRESETTVARWCAMMREMDRHIENLLAAKDKQLKDV